MKITSDNLKIRQPADARKVNVHEAWEATYWTNKWGVPKAQLEAAAHAFGAGSAAVAGHLGKSA